jgi:hypothetical protein
MFETAHGQEWIRHAQIFWMSLKRLTEVPASIDNRVPSISALKERREYWSSTPLVNLDV